MDHQHQHHDDEVPQQQSSSGSSFWQTAFNIGNVIMGVGVLSLPVAFRTSGWLIGLFLILFFGYTASVTARILADCQRLFLVQQGKPLLTYGDIGEATFGPRGRYFIQSIFYCELFAATVALLILVTQTLASLLPWFDPELIKLIAWSLLTVSTWPKSLSLLSYGSMIGVVCLLNLLLVIVIDGLWKHDRPGSLWEVEETSLLPPSWQRLPFSFGLFMAGFAGHACFPGFYTSMREPSRFPTAVKTAFAVGVVFYIIVASTGYLMFGSTLQGIILDNLENPAYPHSLYILTMILIAINPATKYALCLYPIVTDMERVVFSWLGDHPTIATDETSPLLGTQAQSSSSSIGIDGSDFRIDEEFNSSEMQRLSNQNTNQSLTVPVWLQSTFNCIRFHHGVRRALFRTLVSFFVLLVAHFFPHFDRVISLLGSLFAMTSSILFPLLCYISLFQPAGSGQHMYEHVQSSSDPAQISIDEEEDAPLIKTSRPNSLLYASSLEGTPISSKLDVNENVDLDLVASGFVRAPWKRWVAVATFAVCATLGTFGTIWTVLPKIVAPE